MKRARRVGDARQARARINCWSFNTTQKTRRGERWLLQTEEFAGRRWQPAGKGSRLAIAIALFGGCGKTCARLRARMMPFVAGAQAQVCDVRVNLRGGKVAMSQ